MRIRVKIALLVAALNVVVGRADGGGDLSRLRPRTTLAA